MENIPFFIDLLTGSDIESNTGFASEAQFLVVFHLGLGGAVHHEIGLLVELFLVFGADEHIGHEMGLPGDLHDEAHLHAGVGVGAAEAVHNEQALAAELLLGQFLHDLPGSDGHLVVVIGIALGGPPDFSGFAFLGGVVVHDVLVLGRTTGIDARHHVDGAQFGYLAFVKTLETGFGLFVVKNFVRGIVKDFLHTLDAVLFEINIRHKRIFFKSNYLSCKFSKKRLLFQVGRQSFSEARSQGNILQFFGLVQPAGGEGIVLHQIESLGDIVAGAGPLFGRS